MSCGHLLCELIGGSCSLVTSRSRGCHANITSPEVAPDILDEVAALVDRAFEDREAAIRLAAIVRREALDERNLVAIARADELPFADALATLCARRRR